MPDIPAEAVEAAARALAVRMAGFFDFSGEMWREKYREHATHVLAAALPHLRERWLAEVEPAIERLTPCRCDPAYTERRLHQSDCLLEIREDLRDVLGAKEAAE